MISTLKSSHSLTWTLSTNQFESNHTSINLTESLSLRGVEKYNETAKGSNKMDLLTEYLPGIIKENLVRIINASGIKQEKKDLQQEIVKLKQQLEIAKKNTELEKSNVI